MKIQKKIASLVVSSLLLAGFVFGQQERESPCCATVKDALVAASSIKPGMKRADLSKNFTEDGGLQFREEGRYLYRQCQYIQITVKFRSVAPSGNFSPQDTIIEVSKPYIQYPTMD
ncbi:MAG: hypothetical protein ACM3JB_11135 [Acidobacteriaceae bacterium]